MEPDQIIRKGLTIGKQRVLHEILAGPWPPRKIELMEMWFTIDSLEKAGWPTMELPDMNAPAMPAHLNLATAPVKKGALCFFQPAKWYLAIARVAANTPLSVGFMRPAFPGLPFPILTWILSENEKPTACGHIDLREQPTTKDLRLVEGSEVFSGSTTKKLRGAEFAHYGMRIAQCLPWFFVS